MDLPWGDERTKQFVTNVGLITTDGSFGPDVMACEWTHHVSYSPGLIAVCIRPNDATHANIRDTKQFGVSLCAADQSVMSSVAGGNSGKAVDKIKALQELGFKFYKAQKIKPPMVDEAALNVECKLFQEISLGDHTMFVGEVVEASTNSDKEPLAYSKGKYWKIGQNIEKPSAEELERIKKVVEKFRK
ncbi:MAG: flavin reductase family protein [Nitrosopumilaceae archaeon]